MNYENYLSHQLNIEKVMLKVYSASFHVKCLLLSVFN